MPLMISDVLRILVAAAFVQSAGGSLLPEQHPKHLTVATSTSAASVAPGSKVSLFVDVTPDPGIHVYAPGAKDFLPIALTLEPAAGAAIGKTLYPKSELMTFADEKVPVFQKSFRLVQDMTIARSTKRGTTMTISGTVRYQACDDAVCFIPASAPVRWTVSVK
jgi:DsbC/DsbD-like thiol-disulfide interchange protein